MDVAGGTFGFLLEVTLKLCVHSCISVPINHMCHDHMYYILMNYISCTKHSQHSFLLLEIVLLEFSLTTEFLL